MKERWQKILALALAAALTLLGGVQVFADGEQAPLTVGQSEPQLVPMMLAAASAETGTDGLQYSYNDEDLTATVSGYTGTATELVIPAEVTNGSVTYKVTAIGTDAFRGNSTLTSITIPDGVTTIESYAFYDCKSLTNVIIPEGVTYIGNRAFSICTSLKSVSLPASLTECGDAFSDLNLTKVTFAHQEPPDFIWILPEDRPPAFWGSTIEQIQLPEGADEQKWRVALERAGLTNQNGGEIQIIIGEATPPTPDPTPTAPPADSTTAESTSAPAVQQMEQRERPDPQDIEATERYHFWMGVKADLRAAADGERLRVHVPADYTNMPASVMEQIRLLDEDIVVDLRWNGQRLLITPATAQQKTALKAYWTFDQLCGLYAQAQFESM